MRSLILFLLFIPAVAVQASTAQPTEAELDDWMAFLRSVSLPITSEVCSPLLGDKADYATVAAQWVAAHQPQIDRGREFAKAGSPEGRDFEQYHDSMAADFKVKLLAKPEAAQMTICTESLSALRDGVSGDGA